MKFPFLSYLDGSFYFVVIINFCGNFLFVNQLLASEACQAASIFNDLQGTLSSHQGEMAVFARELRRVCASIFTCNLSSIFTLSYRKLFILSLLIFL